MNREEIEREHPKNRPIEPEDPMVLNADAISGDPWLMLDGIVEEYARMGWSGDEIEQLFDQPFYQATHALKQNLGEVAVHARIRRTLSRCGLFCVQATYSDEASGSCRHLPGEMLQTPDGARVPAHPDEPVGPHQEGEKLDC